jgi:hypothetical protein
VARTRGGELFAILGVLDEEAGLRRALSDSSRGTQARAELASRLFGDQVSEATLSLFTSMCESRWSSPADLASAVEEIAVTRVRRGRRAGPASGRPLGPAVPLRAGGDELT